MREGRPVLIRAVRADDRERIVAAFHKLDPQAVYTRFFLNLAAPAPRVADAGPQ